MKKEILPALVLSLTALSLAAQVRKAEPQIPVYPALEEEGSFSLVFLPDPQSYTKFAANQPLFDLQTAWTVQNKDRLRVLAALVSGDLVEQNDKPMAVQEHTLNGDQTSRQQWEAASSALSRMDGILPYIVCQGNHDVGYMSSEVRISEFSKYIYPERNRLVLDCLADTGLSADGRHTLENAAYEFHTPTWGDLLVVVLEFAPRDEALAWARELVGQPRYKDYRVILFTHSFLSTEGEKIPQEGYRLQPRNWGLDIWKKLVEPSSNIKLVLCGHAGRAPSIKGTVDRIEDIDFSMTCSYREDRAADGHLVPQMMFNAQMADGGWFGNGGDCWLRILEFKPDGRTIGVRTFSPLFALSPVTARYAWRTNRYDRFEITVDR